jgi:hypothetical protein
MEDQKTIEKLRNEMFESECLDALKLLGINGIYHKMVNSFNPHSEIQSIEHYNFVRIYNKVKQHE